MEYRLGKIYDFPGKEIRVDMLDVLTLNQFEKINKAILKISELDNNSRLLDFVLLNENELNELFEKSFQKFLSKSVSWNGLKIDDQAELYLNTNRLFLNYLSSVRTLLDHLDVFFNRTYGKDSVQYFQYKKMLSSFYDNSFAYRFFYKLRNYAQHVGLPIDRVQFTSKHSPEAENISGYLQIEFNSKRLLNNFDSWGPVKQDLLSMTEYFSAPPLITELSYTMKEILRNVQLLQKDELIQSSNIIIDLTQHLREDNVEVFMAHEFKEKENGELLGFQSVRIPFESIDYIISKL